jgi:hypothetical protein
LVAACRFRLSHKKAQEAQTRKGMFESLIIVSAFVHFVPFGGGMPVPF